MALDKESKKWFGADREKKTEMKRFRWQTDPTNQFYVTVSQLANAAPAIEFLCEIVVVRWSPDSAHFILLLRPSFASMVEYSSHLYFSWLNSSFSLKSFPLSVFVCFLISFSFSFFLAFARIEEKLPSRTSHQGKLITKRKRIEKKKKITEPDRETTHHRKIKKQQHESQWEF